MCEGVILKIAPVIDNSRQQTELCWKTTCGVGVRVAWGGVVWGGVVWGGVILDLSDLGFGLYGVGWYGMGMGWGGSG